MRNFIISFVLLLLLAPASEGQNARNNRAVLSGSVINVTPVVRQLADEPFVVYEVELLLQLRNDGSNPIIVLSPTHSLTEKRIEFLATPNYEAGAVADSVADPWVSRWRSRKNQAIEDPWPPFLQQLVSAREPSDGFLVIGPGKLIEYREVVTLNNGFTLEIKSGQTNKEFQRNIPRSEYPALRVVYHLPVTKKQKDDNLPKILQERWRPFGHLVLDESADFTLRSETILNKAN